MTQSDREKVAVVLIYDYKNIVDRFKKDRIKSIFGYIQTVELSLYDLTADRPIAKDFFNKVLGYRRKNDDKIETISIPIINDSPEPVQENQPKNIEPQKIQKSREPTVAIMEKTKIDMGTTQEESPFEF